jgi:hypothetical protein
MHPKSELGTSIIRTTANYSTDKLGKTYGDVNIKLRAIYISVLHARRWSVSALRSLDPLCDLGGPQATTDEVENKRDIPLGV